MLEVRNYKSLDMRRNPHERNKEGRKRFCATVLNFFPGMADGLGSSVDSGTCLFSER